MQVATAIDVALARTQHTQYVSALSFLDMVTRTLPADDQYPDCCFVEDCAVIANGAALITRPGAVSRRGETPAVRRALASHPLIERIEALDAPATLDGGDCMHIGDRMFVGRSLRTNEAGVARLRKMFHDLTIVEIPLAEVLHLKCVCSPLGEDRVLLARGTIPPEVFRGLDVVLVPNGESYAANCVAHAGKVILAEGYPETRTELEQRGIATIAIPMSEIRKADGSLTCLSLII